MDIPGKTRKAVDDKGGRDYHSALRVGQAVDTVEAGSLNLLTNRVYRFRTRHPLIYGLAAFIVSGGLVAVFTMTTYKNWAYEGVNLQLAVYQVIFGGLGAGIICTVLAFAYTGTIRQTLGPLQQGGVIAPVKAGGAQPHPSR